MTPELMKEFDRAWLARARDLSLDLAYEPSADKVEWKMKEFASGIDESLRVVCPHFNQQDRNNLIHKAVSLVWQRKQALEQDGCWPRITSKDFACRMLTGVLAAYSSAEATMRF